MARFYLPEAVGDERRERLLGGVSPADAERMPGWVCVHLVALGGIEIRSWLEQPGAEGDCLFVGGSRVVDVEVEVHLLGVPCGQSGGTWFGASCTPNRHCPVASMTLCHSSSSKTWPPRMPAQNALSARRSAASH